MGKLGAFTPARWMAMRGSPLGRSEEKVKEVRGWPVKAREEERNQKALRPVTYGGNTQWLDLNVPCCRPERSIETLTSHIQSRSHWIIQRRFLMTGHGKPWPVPYCGNSKWFYRDLSLWQARGDPDQSHTVEIPNDWTEIFPAIGAWGYHLTSMHRPGKW